MRIDLFRTWRLLLAALWLAGVLVSCGNGAPAGPTVDRSLWRQLPDEKIVFMSKSDSAEGELYLLDKDGIRRLTDDGRHENNPALSPDGGQVAFHGGDLADPLTWEIYVLDLETGRESRLTDNHVLDGHPDWSPDQTRIVFGSFRDEQGNPAATADLYVMDADGSRVRQLTDSEWEDNDPEWSPDGRWIAFKSTRHTQQSAREEIYVLDVQDGNTRRLTTTRGWQSDHDPSWRPDGQAIVFSRFEGSRPWTDIADPALFQEEWAALTPWNVYRVDLAGNLSQLADTDGVLGLPVFSVDGSKLLALELDLILAEDQVVGADHRLMLMEADGDDPRPLLPDNEHTPTLEYFDW